MPNDKHCKLCEETIPKLALHFSNQRAIELGYCCFMCMNSDLGEDKAYSLLGQKPGGKMHESDSKGITK